MATLRKQLRKKVRHGFDKSHQCCVSVLMAKELSGPKIEKQIDAMA